MKMVPRMLQSAPALRRMCESEPGVGGEGLMERG